MCVSNNVVSFNEILRKNIYNYKQRTTKSNNIVVNHEHNFTRVSYKNWKNYDRVLYIMVFKSVYRLYTPTCYYVLLYLLLTPHCICKCMIFYNLMVSEIKAISI